MATLVGSNITDTYGESIYIKSDIPSMGVLALTGFLDDSAGETDTNFFDKRFRISKDGGVTFSGWLALNLTNIQSFTFKNTDVLVIEYLYNKVGDNTSGLSISSISMLAETNLLQKSDVFNNSIFKEFFDITDIRILQWAINVTEKLHGKGILAGYINREDQFGSSEDFLSFWRALSRFFAMFVMYARTYEKFYENEKLIREYLLQRDLKVNTNNSLEELNLLMESYNNQILHRGTIHIVDKVVPDREWELADDVDGELLRFLEYLPQDEFLFNLFKLEHFGWNLDNSSPLHTGLELNENVNKIYETNGKITDLTRWPVTGDVSVEVVGGEDTFKVTGSGGISSQGGLKYIKVDPRLDYLLTFEVKKEDGLNLTIGLDSFNQNGVLIQNKSHTNGVSRNLFLENGNLCRDDYYMTIRCIIYNSQKPIFHQGSLNIGSGNNLILNSNTAKVIPRIMLSGNGNIKNITFTPMNTEYSRGFVQTDNFISVWAENNNKSKSIQEIEDWTRKYLIPYNANLAMVKIGEEINREVEEPRVVANNDYLWVGAGPVCTFVEPIFTGVFVKEFGTEFI